jgi:anaerobic ribonucleoside-triphosphate reductase activating protein
MFDMSPRDIIEADQILEWICLAKDKQGIEGVTFLGGEPMLQAKGLSVVAKRCKEIGLSVVVFTGYTLEYLQKNPMAGVSELISAIDILVDGAYVSTKPETKRNWVGSTNQEFHYLTDRYHPGIEFDPKYPHGFELRLFNDGTLRTNGWPSVYDISWNCKW